MDCERKFVGGVAGRDAALALIRQHCLPDPKYPAGTTESIYFDDPHFSSFWEKINGDHQKRKYRIRWYPDSAPSNPAPFQAYLEVKDRLGAGRAKVHQGFTVERGWLETTVLSDPALIDLLQVQLQRAGLPAMPGLRASVSIRYYRHRFVCPVTQARICFDHTLSCPRSNGTWLPGAWPLVSERVVCEAKSPTHRTWPWSDAIRRLGFRHQSFSKYGEFMERRLNRAE